MDWRRNAPVLCTLIQLLTIFPKAVCMKRVSEGLKELRGLSTYFRSDPRLCFCISLLGALL